MNIDSRLRALLEELPSMVAYWDQQLINQYANKAYLEWLDIDPKDMLGRHLSQIIGPYFFDLNRPYIDGVLGGLPQHFERTIVDADGQERHTKTHYIPDVVEGRVNGFFALVTDHDDLKRVRDELSEAQRLGRIGSWAWNSQTDVTTWSKELYRLFGRDTKLPPPSYAELSKYYTPESWTIHNQGVARLLETGGDYKLELEFIREDGSHGWLVAHAEAIRDSAGAVARLRGTAQDVTERRLIETELLLSRNKLRDMAIHHEIICEEERKQMAREVHDEMGQLLMALRIDLTLLGPFAIHSVEIERLIGDMNSLLARISQATRTLVESLRPPALEMGLMPALEWLAQDFSQRLGIPCCLEADFDESFLRDSLATTIFRIVQESLTNVARHANATEVAISLKCISNFLCIQITDDGIGFNVNLADKNTGFGLLNIHERALALGGCAQIKSEPGKGTTVLIKVPYGINSQQ